MFTGIIECKGIICKTDVDSTNQSKKLLTLDIRPESSNYDAELGDSIAVDGVCLTVAKILDQNTFRFEVSSETLGLTHLADLKPNDRVNLERAMTLATRLGGHLVSGHVDGLAKILEITPDESGWLVRIQIPSALSRYVVAKGSLCLDGVSLTINRLTDTESGSQVELMLVPTTLAKTTLGSRTIGWKAHLEVDIVGKYLERLNLS